MAQAKRKPKAKPKSSWLKRLLIFILIPFFVWFVAFLLWFNWSYLENLFSRGQDDRRVPAKSIRPSGPSDRAPKTAEVPASEEPSPRRRPDAEPGAKSQEKILEQDRKKLEDILKNQR